MKQDEIIGRLRNIVEKYAPLTILPPSANTCWFDGDICPYGFPNGKFQNRPVQICHLGDGGCNRLDMLEENVDDFFGDYEKRIDEKLDNAVKKNKVTLSSELKVIAENIEEGLERKVLELTASIIEEKLDKDIIRVDDI